RLPIPGGRDAAVGKRSLRSPGRSPPHPPQRRDRPSPPGSERAGEATGARNRAPRPSSPPGSGGPGGAAPSHRRPCPEVERADALAADRIGADVEPAPEGDGVVRVEYLFGGALVDVAEGAVEEAGPHGAVRLDD